jgi:hypothetical protein
MTTGYERQAGTPVMRRLSAFSWGSRRHTMAHGITKV